MSIEGQRRLAQEGFIAPIQRVSDQKRCVV